MKYKFLPSIINNSKKGQGITRKGIELTRDELIYYQQMKIKKDIQFFESATPYFTGFTVILTSVIFSAFYINSVYYKKTGESLWKKFYFNLLDIDIEQVLDPKNESDIEKKIIDNEKYIRNSNIKL